MSGTVYTGIPDNESNHTAINIVSSTNASPIRVNVPSHGLLEGARAVIQGHTTNTAANGLWALHVVDADNVELYFTYGGVASVGNGVGGATGTLTAFGFSPDYDIPDDGDPAAAASWNAGLEDHGDRTQKLVEMAGRYKPVHLLTLGVDSSAYGPSIWCQNANVTTSFTRLVDAGGHGGNAADFYDGAFFPYPGVMPFDIVEASFQTTADTTPVGHGPLYFGLAYELFDYGASPSHSFTKIQGSSVLQQDNVIQPLSLTARFQVPNASPKRMRQLQLYVVARVLSTPNPAAFNLLDDRTWKATIWRPTGRILEV